MKAKIKNFSRQILCGVLITMFSATTTLAAMISTEQVREEVAGSLIRDQVEQAFLRDDVRQILTDRGVSETDVLARVAAMSDAEVLRVKQEIDRLPAGAGPGGVLVTVVLVFVILDIIGVTNVFTFIRPQR